jgi:hypothetical protein
MSSDAQLLAGLPQYLSIEMMLKATPAQEGEKRFVYLEASREERDLQNDVVLAKALANSADHFLKFGNIDLDHKSMDAVAKMHGIERPELWEIGAPVEVRVDGTSTFVKAQLFCGDTPLAENANMVWDSMTKLNPPRKWYPSVGGKILAKSVSLDAKTGEKYGVVSSVRWTNIALSQQPVNQHVGGITTIPFGVLAKSWGAGGLDMHKALEASYATDAAGKTGGAALGAQSIDTGAGATPHSYFAFRNQLASALKSGAAADQSPEGLVHYSAGTFGLSLDEAAEWVSRFLNDLKSGLSTIKRSKK